MAPGLEAQMIFAYGARRSGTFWLHRILTAHPDVGEIPSETHLFSHGIAPLWERFHHGPRESGEVARVYMDRERLVEATRAFCDAVFAEYQQPGVPYLCERTPVHVGHAELMATVYPDARFVHIIRDGRDSARSIGAQTWGPESFQAAVVEWRDAVLTGRAASRLGERYVEVRYEDLLAGGREALADLYERAGLRVDDAILDAGLAEMRTERNIDPTGEGIRAEKWRTQLTPEQLATFDATAGEVNESLGYPPTPGGAGRAAVAVRSRRERARERLHLPHREHGDAAGTEAARRIQVALRSGQNVFDAVVSALAGGDFGAVRFADQLLVRVRSGDAEHEQRGADAVALLREIAAGDPAFSGRQVRGTVHAGLPAFSSVLTYELPGGTLATRVVVVNIKDEVVRAVHVYRL